MRQIIEQVLAAEAEAKRIIEAAQAEAEQVISEAQVRAQELLERAHQTAREEAEAAVAAAVGAAEHEKKQRLAQIAIEVGQQVRLSSTRRTGAVEAAVRCLCGESEPSLPSQEYRSPAPRPHPAPAPAQNKASPSGSETSAALDAQVSWVYPP